MSARSSASPPPLTAPFVGIIESTYDALICFEAARRALIPRITRRLLETEKVDLIKSGAVFVFDEEESGIKRWTDGLIWSPSRILSNFLIYRETSARTDRHHPNIVSRTKTSSSARSPSSESASAEEDVALKRERKKSPSPSSVVAVPRRRVKGGGWTGPVDGASKQERERELVGSLTSTYKFKPDGLIKKTISVTINGVHQHLVSYYSMEDALSGKLRSPSSFPELAGLEISEDFLTPSHFRFAPVPEVVDGITRYKESEESMPPRESFNSSAATSPVQKKAPLPRRQIKTLSHPTEPNPSLATLTSSRVATNSPQVEEEEEEKVEESSVASSANSSSGHARQQRQTAFRRHSQSPPSFNSSQYIQHPQPCSREQASPPSLYSNSSYSTESPSTSNSPEVWNAFPSSSQQVYTESHPSGTYGGEIYEQNGMGNDNGKRDRGSWYSPDQQQQLQPPRPCFVSQSSSDSFSHLGYALPSSSEQDPILYHSESFNPSSRPIHANNRVRDTSPSSYPSATPSLTSDYSGSGSFSEQSPQSPFFPYPSASSHSSYTDPQYQPSYHPSPPPSLQQSSLDHWASSSTMSGLHGSCAQFSLELVSPSNNYQNDKGLFAPPPYGAGWEGQHRQQQAAYQLSNGMVGNEGSQGGDGVWYGWGSQ